MATMYVDDSTQKAVIDFNRSNDEYRVAVWFEPDGMVPQRAELESGGRVTVIAEISGWTEGAAAAETETE